MEKQCFLCCELISKESINESTLLDKYRKKSIFDLVCCKLEININSDSTWDFEYETLPFCSHCLTEAYQLENSTKNVADCEFELVNDVERIKHIIKKSDKSHSNLSTIVTRSTDYGNHNNPVFGVVESCRFQEFRKQALESNDSKKGIRRICTKRLFNITGILPPEINHERLENTTDTDTDDDDLSQGESISDDEELETLHPVSQNLQENQCLSLTVPGIVKSEVPAEAVSVAPWPEEELNRLITDGDLKPPKWLVEHGSYYYGMVHVIKSKIDPWKCGLCNFVIPEDKKAHQKKNIEYHIQTKHYTVYKCGVSKCKKRFFGKAELQLHLETGHHDDLLSVKPSTVSSSTKSSCSICGKSYIKAASLKKHELTHTAQVHHEDSPTKIFQCTYCDRDFTRKSNKLRHEEVHLKSKDERKQHLCPICQKPHTKDGLTAHLRLVHKQGGKIDYVKCPENNCSQQFPSHSRLKRHVKTVHKKMN